MSLKSEFTCSYCSKIYRKPVILPCNHCLCEEHLKDIDVLKVKSIQCKTCIQEFSLDGNEFKPNDIVQNLIEKEMHLTEAVKTIKNIGKTFFNEAFGLNEELEDNKRISALKCFEHFQEIRRKIDLQREELKHEIDKIALAMIDQTKKYEALYLENVKEGFSLFDDCKSLEHELNQIEETFRHPNLLIQSIKEM